MSSYVEGNDKFDLKYTLLKVKDLRDKMTYHADSMFSLLFKQRFVGNLKTHLIF